MHVPGLYPFFRRHVHQGFDEQGLAQPALVDYVSELLTRFARVNVLFPFHSADGQPIETIAGLLMQWQAAQGNATVKPGHVRETLVLRHIADYALFMSGVFRDRLKCRGQVTYYREHGRSAFARCARLEPNRQHATVLSRVSHDFEPITNALDQLWHRRLPVPDADLSPLAALWRA
jgi:hypothetical protein